MNTYQFATRLQEAAVFDGWAPAELLAAEQGVYAADVEFVRSHCGPLAQRFLDAVPADYLAEAAAHGLQANCDIRLHALRAGQYPASPGWHCDAAVRETSFGARGDGYEVRRNLIGAISSDRDGVSNTEFLAGELQFASEAPYGNDPQLWEQVDRELRRRQPPTIATRDGVLYEFDPWTLHRVAPARCDGLRLFFRMSMWRVPAGHQPGLSRNEQAYRLLEETDLGAGRYYEDGRPALTA